MKEAIFYVILFVLLMVVFGCCTSTEECGTCDGRGYIHKIEDRDTKIDCMSCNGKGFHCR